jgi:arylsulfatase A-like enzyme
MLTRILEGKPDRYPHDEWIVDTSLEVFAREDPGLAYLLLAQADDAGHAIGAAWDPGEFAPIGVVPRPKRGCADNADYALASRRNALMLREGILDAMRDVDLQFGRLMAGLAEMGVADRATIVLLSDHAMENYYRFGSLAQTDLRALIREAKLADDDELYVGTVCSYAVVHWREDPARAARAKAVLEAHRVRNPLTGVDECPWWVLGRDEMKAGVPGVALPGELYHPYFAEAANAAFKWPDLFVLGKTGWQLPVYAGRMPNTKMAAPKWMPPFMPFNGGHGSVDTLPIVAAIRTPGGAGRVVDRDVRIADLAVTAAARFGLTLRSTTVGRDLTGDLA